MKNVFQFLYQSVFFEKLRNMLLIVLVLYTLQINSLFSQSPNGSGESNLVSLFSSTSLTHSGLSASQQKLYDKVTKGGKAYLVTAGDLSTLQQDGYLNVTLPQETQAEAAVSQVFVVQYIKHFESGFYWYGGAKLSPPSPTQASSPTAQNENTDADYLSIRQNNGVYTGIMRISNKNHRILHLGDGIYVVYEKELTDMHFNCVNSDEPFVDMSHYYDMEWEDGVDYRNDYSCPVTIRALYTQNVIDHAESEEVIIETIRLAVEEANMVFANSHVAPTDVEVQLFDILPSSQFTDYEELVGRPILADEFELNIIDLFEEGEPLDIARGEHDILLLFTEGDFRGQAGIAGTRFAESSGAMAVIEYSEIDNFTTAHEISHIFGCKHQDDSEADFEQGHKFGFDILNIGSTKTTLMFIGDLDDRIPNLSNPRVEINGKKTGIENMADNARMMNLTVCDVAAFRGGTVDELGIWINAPMFDCECEYIVAEAGAVGGGATPATPYSFEWQYSYDGFTFFNNTSSQNIANFAMPCEYLNDAVGPGIFIQLTVTAPSGQEATTTSFVPVRDTDEEGNDCEIVPLKEDDNEIYALKKKSFQKIGQKINVSPNPMENHINIQFLSNENPLFDRIEITDVNGRVVKFYNFSENKIQSFIKIDVSTLNTGLYIVNIFKEGEKIYQQKLIKIK